jgi:hypothetical protein
MNNTTAVRKARRALRACFSFKGHDFADEGDRSHVKKTTNRARRNLDKALVRETV